MNDQEKLPKPASGEILPNSAETAGRSMVSEEQAAMAVETGSTSNPSGGGMLAASGLSDAQGAVAHAQVSQPVATSQSSDMPMTAEDIDLIEKEWVEKAKAIVGATTGDPKRQSAELSKAKKAYIEQRFGKEIPTRE